MLTLTNAITHPKPNVNLTLNLALHSNFTFINTSLLAVDKLKPSPNLPPYPNSNNIHYFPLILNLKLSLNLDTA